MQKKQKLDHGRRGKGEGNRAELTEKSKKKGNRRGKKKETEGGGGEKDKIKNPRVVTLLKRPTSQTDMTENKKEAPSKEEDCVAPLQDQDRSEEKYLEPALGPAITLMKRTDKERGERKNAVDLIEGAHQEEKRLEVTIGGCRHYERICNKFGVGLLKKVVTEELKSIAVSLLYDAQCSTDNTLLESSTQGLNMEGEEEEEELQKVVSLVTVTGEIVGDGEDIGNGNGEECAIQ